MMCRLLGHKYWQSEVIDQWGSRSRIEYDHCVRCGARNCG